MPIESGDSWFSAKAIEVAPFKFSNPGMAIKDFHIGD